jgi:ferredoxin
MKRPILKTAVYLLGFSILAYGAVAIKQVAFINYSKCIKCGTCFKGCPVKAITKTEKDGKIISCVVDPKKCIACGTCIKNCPVKAIKFVPKDSLARTAKTEPIEKEAAVEKPAPKTEKPAAAE